MKNNPFLDLKADTVLPLPATDRFCQAGHRWHQQEIDALILAMASQRPLLVRGEAGSGKSQLARAAAMVLNKDQGCLFDEVLHARYEALDLLYQFDVVERLADAELKELDRSSEKYVKKGKLWQAIAANEQSICSVLLIDEIDKAEADIPNALLGVLGNRSFTVPMTGEVVKAKRMPLVIITTNEERELPPAFVRRCVVLNQNPPEDDEAFKAWLMQRSEAHEHLKIAPAVRKQAAEQVLADRKTALQEGYFSIGLAEYLDLLMALHELTQDEKPEQQAEKQMGWLNRLSTYALVKGADQDQARKSLTMTAQAE